MKNIIKTKLFKISVTVISIIIVILIIVNVKNNLCKYSCFYFKEYNNSYRMTKSPIFSYSAENRVINRYNYLLSSTFQTAALKILKKMSYQFFYMAI